MTPEALERYIQQAGREPRHAAEYEAGKRDASEGKAPRGDWPVIGSLAHMRYRLGYLEAKHDA